MHMGYRDDLTGMSVKQLDKRRFRSTSQAQPLKAKQKVSSELTRPANGRISSRKNCATLPLVTSTHLSLKQIKVIVEVCIYSCMSFNTGNDYCNSKRAKEKLLT